MSITIHGNTIIEARMWREQLLDGSFVFHLAFFKDDETIEFFNKNPIVFVQWSGLTYTCIHDGIAHYEVEFHDPMFERRDQRIKLVALDHGG